MTGETVPSGREKCRLWILRHIKRDMVCPTHNKVTKTCTANRTVHDRDLKARSSRDAYLSLGIVITAWIFQSIRLIDDAQTIMINISPDVLFPYVKRGPGENEQNDPPEDERFLSIRLRNERIDVIDFNISELTSDIRGRGRRLSGRRMGSKLKRYAN